MPILDPDDPTASITYRYCERGQECPDFREGFMHAHGKAESRGADVTPPLRNTQPTVPDVKA